MFTQFATRRVLIQADSLSRLIWACESVRLNLRKKP